MRSVMTRLKSAEIVSSNLGSAVEMSNDEDTFSQRPLDRCSYSRSWRKASFTPKTFQFLSNNCGILLTCVMTRHRIFSNYFFGQEFLGIIVDGTNKFQASASHDCTSSLSHQAQWSPTGSQEMYLFWHRYSMIACQEIDFCYSWDTCISMTTRFSSEAFCFHTRT